MAEPSNKSNKKKSGGAGNVSGASGASKVSASARDGAKEGGVRVARAEFAAGAARREQVPEPAAFEDAPEIAFAGRSNVGKSSLLNMMLARRGLARTSNTPGCTRQINFFDVSLARASRSASAEPPGRIVFVDLPGYGYAKVSKSETRAWKELLEGYLKDRSTLRAVVILVDVRRGLETEEEDLVAFLAAERPSLTVLVVATKLDKIARSAHKPALAKLARGREGRRVEVIGTSAETGAGRDALWARIFGACRVP